MTTYRLFCVWAYVSILWVCECVHECALEIRNARCSILGSSKTCTGRLRLPRRKKTKQTTKIRLKIESIDKVKECYTSIEFRRTIFQVDKARIEIIRRFVVLSLLLINRTPARSIVTYLFLKTLEIFWNFSKIIQKWFNQKHITGSIFAAIFHTDKLTETDFIFLFIYSCPS